MKDKGIRYAYYTLGLLVFILVAGSAGYMFFGFTFSEAVYQTIITIATVGFREVHPLDTPGMWFTSVLIIVSIQSLRDTPGMFYVQGGASEKIISRASADNADIKLKRADNS